MTVLFSPDPSHPDSIDLRSDTITQPTPEMREAMAKAPVGDDVFADDPTVLELERRMAEIFGQEAAMLVPSGTMGNLTGLLALTRPGDAAICEAGAHIYQYEAGGASAVGGVVYRLVPGERGILDPEDVKAAIVQENYHKPWTTVLCLENTHNTAGGTCIPFDRFEELCAVAREAELSIHLDGARLWNASIATGIPVREYARRVDTVTSCFSKGLSAPIGSIVGGSKDVIHLARKKRKMLGGGMRQAGVMAAAALVALDTMRERLAEDHARARALAEHISDLPGFSVDLHNVETNIVMLDVADFDMPASDITAQLAEHRVRCLPLSPTRIRLVTNRHFTDEKLDRAKKAFTVVSGG